MAPPPGHMRPWRYLAAFAGIVAVLYAVVFFTGDRQPIPELGIDLRGGTRVTLTAITPDGSPPQPEQLKQAKQIIEQRVNGLGVSGAEVVRNGNNLVITVPGENGEQARKLSRTAKLYFRPVKEARAVVPGPAGQRGGQQRSEPVNRQPTKPPQQSDALQNLDCGTADPIRTADPDKPLVTCNQNGTEKYRLGPAIMSGEHIDEVSYGPDPRGAGYEVRLTFDGKGREIWAHYTAQHVRDRVAFVLDGQVASAPVITEANASGRTSITGSFNAAQAEDLANVLKYGALPLSFKISAAQTVSATLGLTSLRAGLIAGAIGLAVVFVYCLFYYRALGVLTILSLVLSGTLVYGVLVVLGRWIGFTLDLAGVAGLIVAIGITADSFVVYFERLKDEIRDGRTFRSAVPRGWVRARRTILSADAVSFLAAAVLYVLAVGQVKGFAFTLGMSTVLDLVVVFLVTHPLVTLASRSRTWSRPGVSGLGAVQRMAARSRSGKPAAAKGA